MQTSAGPVTFLFTDIEGSTRLWDAAPERMRPALARHDAIAQDTVLRHRGRVVKTTGDGIHAVFDDPLDAIAATLDRGAAQQPPPPGHLVYRPRARVEGGQPTVGRHAVPNACRARRHREDASLPSGGRRCARRLS